MQFCIFSALFLEIAVSICWKHSEKTYGKKKLIIFKSVLVQSRNLPSFGFFCQLKIIFLWMSSRRDLPVGCCVCFPKSHDHFMIPKGKHCYIMQKKKKNCRWSQQLEVNRPFYYLPNMFSFWNKNQLYLEKSLFIQSNIFE